MAMTVPVGPYGEGRIRSNVSYVAVERAAIAILKSERRPTVETILEALGGGSPDTIGDALGRFWRDLGARIDGDPAALTRMPAKIADLADGMRQRALKLAGETAAHDDNAARERLRQIEVENDIKQRSVELREREIDAQARERELALDDARDHLVSLSKALARERATNQAQVPRIGDLETEVAQYRQQIGALIAGAIAEKRPAQRRRASKAVRPAPRASRSPYYRVHLEEDLWSAWVLTSVNGRSSTPLGRARCRPAATIDAALLKLAHIAKRRRQRGYELMR